MRIHTAAPILALMIALTGAGLWLAARVWPEQICDSRAGLRVHAQRDARATGYRLSAREERQLRAAAYDLVQGRVAFFERETGDGLLRYQLGDRRSRHCLRREQVDELLEGLPFPAGQCVQVQPSAAPASRYRVEVEPDAGGLNWARVIDAQDNETLAEYRRSPAALLELACARTAPGTHGRFTGIAGFVFKDRWGRTLQPTDIESGIDGDLPPVTAVRARLAQDGRLDRNDCHLPGWMGETEVHEIQLPGGPLEVEARLDPASNKAGVVLLDVHTPEKAVVIIAKAERPTLWHVHESSRSSLVAFLVRGAGGQAVLGLTPYTRILMSTREHNPATNCSAADLERIEHEVTRRYGRPRQHRQAMVDGKPAVRYGIGEPMTDGSLVFYHDRELADFELSEDKD